MPKRGRRRGRPTQKRMQTMSIDDRQRLNQQRPIVALPAETLVRVFGYFIEHERQSYIDRSWDHDADAEDKMDSPCLALLNLTQVCSSWRSIALNAPVLWRTACFTGTRVSQSLAEEFMRRSSPRRPFHVIVQTQPTRKPEYDPMSMVADMFQNEIQDVKTMTLCVGHPNPDTSIFNKEAHQIETLTVVAIKHGYFTFPKTLFAGCYPNLRRLKLRNLYFQPGSVLKNITHISLKGIFAKSFWDKDYSIEVLHLLKILKESPGLEELELEAVGPQVLKRSDIDRIEDDDNLPVHFPVLRRISLEKFLSSATPYSLLKAIRAPSLSSLSISHKGAADEREEVVPDEMRFEEGASKADTAEINVDVEDGLVCLMLRTLGCWDDVHFESKKTDWWNMLKWPADIRSSESSSVCPCFVDYGAGSHKLRYYVDNQHDEQLVQSTMSFVEHFIPQDITMVTIDFPNTYVNSFPFEEILERFAKIRCLEIREDTDYAVHGRFTTALQKIARRSGFNVPLPNLEALLLFNEEWSTQSDDGFVSLCYFLKKRIELGKPLLHLRLVYSRVSKKLLAMLRKLVHKRNVVYDDQEIPRLEKEYGVEDEVVARKYFGISG
ncbi:hypothetical protein SCHPADRAFT_249330 [Schizopora paradoxa]|uniref:F-box domain-containing protein n=1 Tax=Schizopora paradoxa TaxID=27342 RepID=A0A0H2RV93_9AGAM|nr:hypothetical protein SCHPADRAFT_249330 [Schizopora paradoxa]